MITSKPLTRVANNEKVAKVFVVVGEDKRKCLVCDQLFTRQESYEHSLVTCFPRAYFLRKESPNGA
jgi:hypothetical protein